MERAPLPPHERAWRHPSEVAAHTSASLASEPVSTTGRSLAIATGAVTLLAIGMLVVSMSPERGRDAGPTPTVASALLSVPRVTAVAVTTVDRDRAEPVDERPAPPVVTPIGDGFVAVATGVAVRRTLGAATTVDTEDGSIAVVLHSGDEVDAQVVETGASGDLVVVQLAEWAGGALELADDVPEAAERVVVMTEPPVEVALERVSEVGAPDGTPVVDADGHLIGLCTDDAQGRRVVTIAELRGDATTDVPG